MNVCDRHWPNGFHRPARLRVGCAAMGLGLVLVTPRVMVSIFSEDLKVCRGRLWSAPPGAASTILGEDNGGAELLVSARDVEESVSHPKVSRRVPAVGVHHAPLQAEAHAWLSLTTARADRTSERRAPAPRNRLVPNRRCSLSPVRRASLAAKLPERGVDISRPRRCQLGEPSRCDRIHLDDLEIDAKCTRPSP